jgi:chromosome segregation ATPase
VTTHKWKDIEHKRDKRISELIEQARGGRMDRRDVLALADALEAATDDVKLRNQELAVLGSDVRDAQGEVEVLTQALEAVEADRGRLALEAATADQDWKRAEAKNERLREALEAITRELGVPDENYPAPVANAVEVARAALAGSGDE